MMKQNFEKREFVTEMLKLYGMEIYIAVSLSLDEMSKEEKADAYSRIYQYLYDKDKGHKIVNQLYPIYEKVIDEHLNNARKFQREVLDGNIIMSDREYAAAAITMYLYDNVVQEMVKEEGLVSVANMVLYYALGKQNFQIYHPVRIGWQNVEIVPLK